ncbi:glycosyltransferase [Gottfriedia sp. NPDC056225]|uniref:bifunctional glycosyltransferase family 2/GtrA family protein n=1 Tax=Gottfriedia sp. NPDC056225 TaxID=3345751 RepID=UPI001559FA5D|nr:bifunctional glycosyltransferase family 2/GtrA family protein [Arthrobacter citreus]
MQYHFPVILIPALSPDDRLIHLVKELKSKFNPHIIVVNDGSDAKYNGIFQNLRQVDKCTVLEHPHNLGKGMALKTGISYFLKNFSNSAGLVTADCDGQHTPKDIDQVANALMASPDNLILGVRNFSEENIPFRSRFGNTLTRSIFKYLTGLSITDTQTGLRGIPVSYMKFLLDMSGARFEYELNMLLGCKQQGIDIKETQIETIYLDKNSSSHFNPLVDSIKIYFVFFKFLSSSLISFVVDYGLFVLFIFLLEHRIGTSAAVLWAGIISRVISSIVNYILNAKTVFKHSSARSVIRYYILSGIQMIVSAYGVTFLQNAFHGGASILKIVVDLLLSFSSFKIQNEWVFEKTKKRQKVSKA